MTRRTPGNGKTLIVRHLLSRLGSHTVVLLTGWGLHMVGRGRARGRGAAAPRPLAAPFPPGAFPRGQAWAVTSGWRGYRRLH